MKEGLLFTNCIGFNTFYQMFQLSMLLSYLLCSSLLSSSFASYVVNLQMPKPKKTENKELLGTFCTILSCSRTKVKSENKFPQKIAKSSYLCSLHSFFIIISSSQSRGSPPPTPQSSATFAFTNKKNEAYSTTLVSDISAK